jgi:hypothetical protein
MSAALRAVAAFSPKGHVGLFSAACFIHVNFSMVRSQAYLKSLCVYRWCAHQVLKVLKSHRSSVSRWCAHHMGKHTYQKYRG